AALRDSINASTNVNCNGGNTGSATVGVKGGTSPYTYSWNTSPVQTTATATGLVAGNYTVTVTDVNSCTTTATVTITQNAIIHPNIEHGNVSCNGGTDGWASVDPTGGVYPYSYSWSTSPVQTTYRASGLSAGTYTVTITDAVGCTATATVNVTQPPAIRDSISTSTNVSCSGGSNGSATVGVKGGVSPYTYSWNTSPVQTSAIATGLSAGSYTVIITDANSCTANATVTISQPSQLRDSISASASISCYGGSNNGTATVGVKGGTGPYTYSWNTSPVQTTATATGLSAGSYTVTVTDANNCSANITPTVIITQPLQLRDSITAFTNAGCSGSANGSATVGVKGGTGAYTYSWNTSPVQTTATATNLAAGSYTVTVTDANNCNVTAAVTITQVSTIVVNIGDVINDQCNGGNTGKAYSGADGGTAPYTYSWNTSPVQTTSTASQLAAGTYTLTVTDANGCTGTNTVTITQPPAIRDSITSITNISCSVRTGSATVGVKGGTSPYTYAWSRSGATGATATNLSVGSYTVTITDANGCTNTATAAISQQNSVSASATSTSACSPSLGSATATASGGATPYTYSWLPGGGTNATDNNLTTGVYSVIVTDANSCTVMATTTVTVSNTPVVTVWPSSATITPPQNVALAVSGSGGTAPYSFTWSPSAGLSATTGANVTASPTVTTVYTITVNDANGICTGNVTTTVTVSGGTTPQTPTSCDTCIGGLNLQPGKTYLVSVWVKDNIANPTDTTYLNPEISLIFHLTNSTTTTLGPYKAQGRIIDGWQRIESQFTVPATSTDFNIQLSCATGQCNFDDIRVFPFNGTLKTYVYDPNTLRLMAVLDERNYATIYEYDEEGKLIRVKKETERGVMTIQESRTSMQKKQ
ncbi:MAG TPA: hypothetical protein VN922_06180, partial [Bacteroidia bacterium]|nr:hypothetical protein [Bacteroidia bacterium]